MKGRVSAFGQFLLVLQICGHVICGSAEEMDLSGYTLEELKALQNRIQFVVQENAESS